MFDNRPSLSAAILFVMASPALAQSSWPTTIGSTPAPALGITPGIAQGITLGIAAAATANDRPTNSSAYGIKTAPMATANAGPGRLRSSTR